MKTLTGFFKCASIIFDGANYAQRPSSNLGFITIKRGDIGFYEVSFCLAHLPRVEGVHKSSEMAAFESSSPFRLIMGIGEVCYEGLIPGVTILGNAPQSISGG